MPDGRTAGRDRALADQADVILPDALVESDAVKMNPSVIVRVTKILGVGDVASQGPSPRTLAYPLIEHGACDGEFLIIDQYRIRRRSVSEHFPQLEGAPLRRRVRVAD